MENKIRTVSTIAGFGASIVAMNIIFTVFRWLWPLTFGDMDRWGSWIDDPSKVNVGTMHRAADLAIWLCYIALMLYTVFLAIRLCVRYRRGEYFETQTYQNIFKLGLCISSTVLAYYVVMNLHALIVSSTIEGASYLDYAFLRIDSTLFTVIFCGVFFCVIGWVMKIASEIKSENEEIV